MWKKYKKIWITIIVIVLLIFSKDILLRSVIENSVGAVTGLRLRIGSFRVGFIRSMISIKDLKLYNPRGYEDKIMVDIPEIYLDFNPLEMMRGYFHFSEVRIHLKELGVVKNDKGELNLDSLKVVQKSKKEQQEPKKQTPAKKTNMKIDLLLLKAEKAFYKDYTQTPVSIKEYNINLNVQYKDITSMEALVSLIMTKVLMNTAISNLTGFDINSLQSSIMNSLGNGYDLNGITSKIDINKVEKTVDEAISNVSNKLSGLFSN
ncbi:MAG: AsmA family protein [Candidatus Omnitrophica bacterium]|nr:AsmA family protein [Candidatus Omnitrophota bacterium]